MTRFERAQRVVAAAYARRTADGITLELLESLERENAALRASIHEFKRTHGLRTGRYVIGSTVAASIAWIGLLGALYWYGFTLEGRAFHEGFAVGYQSMP